MTGLAIISMINAGHLSVHSDRLPKERLSVKPKREQHRMRKDCVSPVAADSPPTDCFTLYNVPPDLSASVSSQVRHYINTKHELRFQKYM